jgi:hypothetical protein
MGSHRQHHYDVRRSDQCLYCKKRAAGLTTYTTHFFIINSWILISNLTIFLAGKSFTERRMIRYRKLLAATDFDWFLYSKWLGRPVGDRHCYFT